MLVAHIAGFPVEEVLAAVLPIGTAGMVGGRLYLRRLRPRRRGPGEGGRS